MQKTIKCDTCCIKITVNLERCTLKEIVEENFKWSKWDGKYNCCRKCSFERFTQLKEFEKAGRYR